MKNPVLCSILLLIVAALLASQPALSQVQNQDAKKAGDDQQGAVRLKTQLVEVKAVVTDKHGQAITGLSKEDFEVRENGHLQEISFFSAESVGSPNAAVGPAPVRPPASTRPGEVNPLPGIAPQRTVVIFVDSFNMSATSLLRAKQALRTFVDQKLSDQDMVAIVASSGSLGMLGQFTRDRAILRYAIERIGAWRVGSSSQFTSYLAAQVEAEDPIALGVAVRVVTREDHLGGLPPSSLQSYAHNRARQILLEAAQGRRLALTTMKAVIERLAGMPGQRIVAMVSDGFTLRDESGRMDTSELQEVTSKAARQGIVIYSVFAPGLQTLPLFEASQSGIPSATDFTYARGAEDDDKNVLNALAKDTGGDAFFNNNDLLGLLQKGLDANRVYYSLAYYPTDTSNEKKFRNLSVKVRNHPEYAVRSQKGYIPFESAKEAKLEAAATPEQRLIRAMGAPLAVTEIGVENSAEYYERESDQSQVFLHTYIAGDGLDYHSDNGVYQFKLEVVTDVFDQKGKVAFGKSETLSGNLKPASAELAKKNGFSLAQRISLKPGLYQIRIGVQEDSTGKIGTASSWIEVPDLARKKRAMSSVLIGPERDASQAAGSSIDSTSIHTIKFFKKGGKIVYAFNVYSSPVESDGSSRLQMQVEFVNGSEVIAQSGWSAIATHQVGKDKLGILVGGEVPVPNVKPGVYELRVALKDPKSKQNLQAITEFGIAQD